ncbi:hypothetical protein GQR58_029509 [Nymphon striatum]|nr:hypothetical protein GQR58_029509 [Nymphon striatum]
MSAVPMMDHSWPNFNHLSHLSASKGSLIDKSKNNHSAMANFPAIPSTAFSRQDGSFTGFPQNLILPSSGSHGSPNDAFLNNASTELLKAGYGTATTLLSYPGVAASQSNLTHSSLFNSFQPKENELCDNFSRNLQSFSMLATSSHSQMVSRANSDPFSSSLHGPGSSGTWSLPAPSLTSSMFGVLPHESVGSKASEKIRSTKGQSKNYGVACSGPPTTTVNCTTVSKAGSFVFGTSPSAGTTAKTVLSNHLLSSPTYLPHTQYNSFLNLNDKKDALDQNNSALDYTSGNNASSTSIKINLDSDAQKTTKCDSDNSHQSPMMACQSPASNHHSPMVSSAVISPVEPSVYSPASNLKYSDHNFEGGTENNQRKFSSTNASSTTPCSSHISLDLAKAHPSPHNSSVCTNSPLNSSTAGSPFIGESPRESVSSSKDFTCVNSDLQTANYDRQHSVLSPTTCNLSSEDNYDLITQRASATALDSVFQDPSNIDELTLQELSKLTSADATKLNNINATNNNGNKLHSNLLMNNGPLSSDSGVSQGNESSPYQQVQLMDDINSRKLKSANITSPTSSVTDLGVIQPVEQLKIKKDNVQNLNSVVSDSSRSVLDHNSDNSNKSSSGIAEKKSSTPKFGLSGGKPAGFLSSYVSFIKNSSPPKVKRKRGRPRKSSNVGEPVLNSIVSNLPIKQVKKERTNDGNVPGSFTFSDSEEETSHNIADNVQLALKSLTDDNIEKNSIKTASENIVTAPKVVQKRRIYENCVDTQNLNENAKPADVYDFDDFESFDAGPSPTNFKASSHKKKSFRKSSPGRSQNKTTPGNSAEEAVRRLSMRKCVEKLIQKREQRTADSKYPHLR